MNELISKLHKCDASFLELKNVEIPSELFLTKNVKLCNFRNVSVLSKNGIKMPLEKIVENLPSICGFKFSFDSNSLNVSSKTVKELIKIPHFSEISYFSLINISENFDIQTLFNFLKRNSSPKFHLKYQNNRLSNKYKNELEKIVDEILETKSLKYDPPFISFPLQNEFKLAAFRKLFEK
uniref:Uncharacterized protein n=1 Tax=Panagrolaimus davidi TaxID=227884 RepID=A0A914QEQ5_9BILA